MTRAVSGFCGSVILAANSKRPEPFLNAEPLRSMMPGARRLTFSPWLAGFPRTNTTGSIGCGKSTTTIARAGANGLAALNPSMSR